MDCNPKECLDKKLWKKCIETNKDNTIFDMFYYCQQYHGHYGYFGIHCEKVEILKKFCREPNKFLENFKHNDYSLYGFCSTLPGKIHICRYCINYLKYLKNRCPQVPDDICIPKFVGIT
jgi:hypothetical protein